MPPPPLFVDPLYIPEDIGSEKVSPAGCSSVEIQTPASLLSHSPREEKLKCALKKLRQENNKLRKKIEAIQKQKGQPTVEDFKQLCDTFLTPELASFVKWEVKDPNRPSSGDRYSDL